MTEQLESMNGSILQMQGPDARDYLHRISTLNLKDAATLEKLKLEKIPGALLRPTGKFDLFFHLHATADDCFEVHTPYPAAFALEALDRMHFLDRFEIRILREASGDPTPNFAQELRRIASLTPSYPCEINEANNPLELGLANIIHANKGCYPGQEVIEKIITRGEAPRHLCLLGVSEKLLITKSLEQFRLECLEKKLLSSAVIATREEIKAEGLNALVSRLPADSDRFLLGLTLLNKTVLKSATTEGNPFTINEAPATIIS